MHFVGCWPSYFFSPCFDLDWKFVTVFPSSASLLSSHLPPPLCVSSANQTCASALFWQASTDSHMRACTRSGWPSFTLQPTFLLATSILLCYCLAAKVMSPSPSCPSSSPHPYSSLLVILSLPFFPYLAAWLAGREDEKESKQNHWNIHGRTGPFRTHMHFWYVAFPCIMHDYLYLWLLSILLFHLQSRRLPGLHSKDMYPVIFTVRSLVNISNSQNRVG